MKICTTCFCDLLVTLQVPFFLVECVYVTFIAETSSVDLSRVYAKVNYAIQEEIDIVIK